MARGGGKVLYRERKRSYDQNFHGNGNQNGIFFYFIFMDKERNKKMISSLKCEV